jgi:uracil-DNA glycosylase
VGLDLITKIEAAIGTIPADWVTAIGPAASPERLAPIAKYVASRRQQTPGVLPEPEGVFAALATTPFDAVRAVILGQDPYPTRAHAMGLAFSVPRDLPPPFPPSLRNIHAELLIDGGWAVPGHGSLEAWARRGVLLLNTTLTVQEGAPGSHRAAGWQVLTDAIITAVAAREQPAAFLLWGEHAKAKAGLIDPERHVIVPSSHPSPLSQKGFLGSRPFSRANEGLVQRASSAIDWSLEG